MNVATLGLLRARKVLQALEDLFVCLFVCLSLSVHTPAVLMRVYAMARTLPHIAPVVVPAGAPSCRALHLQLQLAGMHRARPAPTQYIASLRGCVCHTCSKVVLASCKAADDHSTSIHPKTHISHIIVVVE